MGTLASFVTYRELAKDMAAWASSLPQDLAAVVGIPRSGIIPATMLSLNLNVHLATLDSVIAGERTWERKLRRGQRGEGNHILIVDDSINNGRTLRNVRGKLVRSPFKVSYAIPYYDQLKPPGVHTYRRVPQLRVFEWNLFHAMRTKAAILDIDGVLCPNPREKEADSGAAHDRFVRHLRTTPSLYIPTVPVLGLVTGRLEKYRAITEKWLADHEVRYGFLEMSKHPTAAARRKAGNAWQVKAAVYARTRNAQMFIESSEKQSKAIVKATRRPVICIDVMRFYPGGR